jgi:hypothetical protein
LIIPISYSSVCTVTDRDSKKLYNTVCEIPEFPTTVKQGDSGVCEVLIWSSDRMTYNITYVLCSEVNIFSEMPFFLCKATDIKTRESTFYSSCTLPPERGNLSFDERICEVEIIENSSTIVSKGYWRCDDVKLENITDIEFPDQNEKKEGSRWWIYLLIAIFTIIILVGLMYAFSLKNSQRQIYFFLLLLVIIPSVFSQTWTPITTCGYTISGNNGYYKLMNSLNIVYPSCMNYAVRITGSNNTLDLNYQPIYVNYGGTSTYIMTIGGNNNHIYHGNVARQSGCIVQGFYFDGATNSSLRDTYVDMTCSGSCGGFPVFIRGGSKNIYVDNVTWRSARGAYVVFGDNQCIFINNSGLQNISDYCDTPPNMGYQLSRVWDSNWVHFRDYITSTLDIQETNSNSIYCGRWESQDDDGTNNTFTNTSTPENCPTGFYWNDRCELFEEETTTTIPPIPPPPPCFIRDIQFQNGVLSVVETLLGASLDFILCIQPMYIFLFLAFIGLLILTIIKGFSRA